MLVEPSWRPPRRSAMKRGAASRVWRAMRRRIKVASDHAALASSPVTPGVTGDTLRHRGPRTPRKALAPRPWRGRRPRRRRHHRGEWGARNRRDRGRADADPRHTRSGGRARRWMGRVRTATPASGTDCSRCPWRGTPLPAIALRHPGRHAPRSVRFAFDARAGGGATLLDCGLRADRREPDERLEPGALLYRRHLRRAGEHLWALCGVGRSGKCRRRAWIGRGAAGRRDPRMGGAMPLEGRLEGRGQVWIGLSDPPILGTLFERDGHTWAVVRITETEVWTVAGPCGAMWCYVCGRMEFWLRKATL